MFWSHTSILGGIETLLSLKSNMVKRYSYHSCRDYLKSGWCIEEFIMGHTQLVHSWTNFIIFIMVDDIHLDDLPEEMRSYATTRTYIDAVEMKSQKDLDLFRKKVLYSMPQTSLKDVPKAPANQAGRNPNFPPLFNRINNYGRYNRKMEKRNRQEVQEQGNAKEVELV